MFFKRKPPPAPRPPELVFREPERIVDTVTAPDHLDVQSLDALLSGPQYEAAVRYFTEYPRRSYMSDHSRATLFMLTRALRPKIVAEIGTLYAGTTEVFARALWENGEGEIHTADPFGGERCPYIIGHWPKPLRDITRYHHRNSMDLFNEIEKNHYEVGIFLIDGNHDYEYALFDLMMAARFVDRGGIVVMDNAEQSGPFMATRTFLRENPAWKELGSAVGSHDPAHPFNLTDVGTEFFSRASRPFTTFLILKAPDGFPIGERPHSWGQEFVKRTTLGGFEFRLPQQRAAGTLHYIAIFRSFPKAGGSVVEMKSIGALPINVDAARTQTLRLDQPLTLEPGPGSLYSVEIEVAWQADDGVTPLLIADRPASLE